MWHQYPADQIILIEHAGESSKLCPKADEMLFNRSDKSDLAQKTVSGTFSNMWCETQSVFN